MVRFIRNWVRAVLALRFGLLLAIGLGTLPLVRGEDWKPLFNGRDLSGWVLVNTPPTTWMVQEGVLICSGQPIGEIRTDRMYQNFVMEIEWRHMIPGGNGGIFVWADDITARGVPFHRSIEVQVLDLAYGDSESHTTHGDIFPIHGATMKPLNGRGGDRAFPTEKHARPSPEWNHYRITCQDGSIALEVNGHLVTRGTNAVPRKGYICLESEGGVVHYRHLRIRELPDTPIDPSQIAVADRGYRSIYTGQDLTGWRVSPNDSGRWRAEDWQLVYDGAGSSVDGTLATNEAFGNFGFLFDFKGGESFRSLVVGLRAPGKRSGFALDPQQEPMSLHFEKPGRWNRCEGTVRNNRLTVSLNGHPIVVDEELEPGAASLQLMPHGEVRFANLYVRPRN